MQEIKFLELTNDMVFKTLWYRGDKNIRKYLERMVEYALGHPIVSKDKTYKMEDIYKDFALLLSKSYKEKEEIVSIVDLEISKVKEILGIKE